MSQDQPIVIGNAILVEDESLPLLKPLPKFTVTVTPVRPAPAPVAAPVLPPHAFARIDPNLLYPPFRKKLEQLIINCQARGVSYWIISGLRTMAEQAALFAQGRTKEGKIVTNAKAGHSFHQYGVAADSCRDLNADRAGLQPGWNLADYKVLAEEADKLGLEAAYYWKTFKEGPHVQLPCSRLGITTDQLLSAFNAGGMKAVWHLLDKFNW